MVLRECPSHTDNQHAPYKWRRIYVGKGKNEYEWQRKKKKWLSPNKMMVGKEEVDHEHVSLLCSTQVGCPSVRVWYVLWTALRSGHWPDERRYISNHFIHSFILSHFSQNRDSPRIKHITNVLRMAFSQNECYSIVFFKYH